MNSLEGLLLLILPNKTTGASSALVRRICIWMERESHTVLFFENLQGESPVGQRTVQTCPKSGMAVQEFEDKVSKKQLPMAVTGVSQPLPILYSCWNIVTSLIAQRIEVVGTETGAAMAAIGSFQD